MTLLLTNDDVERVLTMRDCLDVMETAYAELGEGIGVSRTVSQIFTPTPHSPDALYSFKSMDGVAPFAGVAAIRLASEILTWPKDARRPRQEGAHRRGAERALHRARAPVQHDDRRAAGDLPGRRRPENARRRDHAGSPRNISRARTHATSPCSAAAGRRPRRFSRSREVRNVARMRCFSPNAERRAAFAQEMRGKTGIEVVAAASGPEAVRGADVVLCATNSQSPVFFADWIEPGMHISTVQHAELDPNVFAKADVLIGHYTGWPAGGDRFKPRHRACGTRPKVMRKAVRAAIGEHELPNLHDLVLGRAQGRTAPEQVTCFLNYVGLGYQFAAVGSVVNRKAREQGVGRDLPTDWFTEDVILMRGRRTKRTCQRARPVDASRDRPASRAMPSACSRRSRAPTRCLTASTGCSGPTSS